MQRGSHRLVVGTAGATRGSIPLRGSELRRVRPPLDQPRGCRLRCHHRASRLPAANGVPEVRRPYRPGIRDCFDAISPFRARLVPVATIQLRAQLLMKYFARLPGMPEVLGPMAHRVGRMKILPAGLRGAIGHACATYLALPGYVRSFSVAVAGTEITMAAKPKVSLVGLAYYRGLDGFEPATVALFAALARQARAIVDVGANVGVFSLLAARLQPEARILAFEPQPVVAMSLARNVALSGTRKVEV